MKKIIPFISILLVIIAVLVFFAYSFVPLLATITGKSQLAQILAIETTILKKWQQDGSLKHNLALGAEGADV